jgi:hypothetical protein
VKAAPIFYRPAPRTTGDTTPGANWTDAQKMGFVGTLGTIPLFYRPRPALRLVRSAPAPRLDTGVIERRNPLPPGRYWVDVFPPHLDTFAAWLKTHGPTSGGGDGSVTVEETETFEGASDGSMPPRDFYIFDVSAPVNWEGPGLPTVATPNIKASDDTVQKPAPVPNVLDQIPGSLAPGSSWWTVSWPLILVAAAVAGLAYLILGRGKKAA